MKKDDLIDSIGLIDDEFLIDFENRKSKSRRNKTISISTAILIAACLSILIASLAIADKNIPTLSSILNDTLNIETDDSVNKWGNIQTDSCSLQGYTLTVDATFGDKYSCVVLYTLSKDDGTDLPKGLTFSKWRVNILGTRSHQLEIIEDLHYGNKVHIIERYINRDPIIGKTIKSVFSDLVVRNGDENSECTLVNGSFSTSHTLKYTDETHEIELNNIEITDINNRKAVFNKLIYSPVGINLIGYTDSDNSIAGLIYDVKLVLKDGKSVELNCGHQMTTMGDNEISDFYNYAMFESDFIIKPEEMDYILIAEEKIEIN